MSDGISKCIGKFFSLKKQPLAVSYRNGVVFLLHESQFKESDKSSETFEETCIVILHITTFPSSAITPPDFTVHNKMFFVN